MRRRRPGIGGLQTAAAARDQYRLLGGNVAKLRTDIMKEQLATFRSRLEDFARKRKPGVQIVEICLATRPHNGGLINLQELCGLLRQKRKGSREVVSGDNCLRTISKLKVLGSGFEVISIGKKKLVQSVPTELNKDHNQIIKLAQSQGFATINDVEKRLSWTSSRAIVALDKLLEGFCND